MKQRISQSRSMMEPLEDRRLMATYYISPSGNDANPGTSSAAPFKSLLKVSTLNLAAGDQVLLQGGATHVGTLYFDAGDKGNASSPIKVGSYGTGQATISNNSQPGIYAFNTAGISIANLALVGRYNASAPSNLTGMPDGISFYTTLPNNVKLAYVKIDNVTVRNFNRGISIGSYNGSTGYKDVSITNARVYDNLRAGVTTFAINPNSHQNIYVARVRAWNNTGVPFPAGTTPSEISGNGIVLGGVNTGKIEHSTAWKNGVYGDGGAGIWAYDSTRITIQFCESYENKTAGARDGDGFDLDQNTSNSVMQYNYSHDNHGGGFLLATKFSNSSHTNNIVRYNISQNDGRKNSYGGIHIWGKVLKAEIYNNTIFSSTKSGAAPAGIRIHNRSIPSNDVANVHLRNNIIQTTGGVTLVEVSADQINGAVDLKFQGNAYHSTGAAFKIIYGSSTFSTLSSWRTSKGQEMVGTMKVGFQGDPKLTNPGGGGVIFDTANLPTLSAYRLQSTSPLINAGLNLSTLFALNPGSRDFWGDSLPRGLTYDVGADEF